MSFFNIWKKWFCFAWMPLFFGGDSSSETKNETKNFDQRVLLEEGGVAGSASDGAVLTINALDGGAIKAAFGLGSQALDHVTDLATASQSASARTTEAALKGAFNTIGGTREAYADALNQVSKFAGQSLDKVESAYEESKIGNRSIMTMGALLIGGVVVVMALKKG